jgi:hypothetical protein
MRYKHEIFTKMILKDDFISFLFNNISALCLSNGSGWIERLPCTARKTPESCFRTRPYASKSELSKCYENKQHVAKNRMSLIYFTRYVSFNLDATRGSGWFRVSCFIHFACIEDEPWREL